MGTAIKHPVPDRVKPSFVIFDIRALWRSYRIVSKIPVHQSPGLREEGHPHPAKYSHNFVLVRPQS